MKIAHLADIHIRLFSRHDEYVHVFKKTFDSLKYHNPDIIVICGDLFHSKINLSPEAIDLATKFLVGCTNLTETILIIGNHDASLKSKNSRMDSLTPLRKLVGKTKNNLHISVDTERIFVKDLAFYHYSCKDNEVFTDEELNQDDFKICLHHGMVVGSKNNAGQVFDRSDRDNIPFDKFNITLLGDIHKLQTINETIFYPSSLICQDFGEHPTEHGYLFHTIENNKTIISKFIEIDNDYAHFTFNAVGNKIDYKEYKNRITDKSNIRIYFNSLSSKDEVIKAFRKDFPNVKNVKFEDLDTISVINGNIDVDIDKIDVHSLDFHEKQFKEYFKNVDESLLRDILELNKKLYSEVVSKKDFKSKNFNFTLNSLKFDNVFSYGENNKVNFDKYRGVIGLFSKNGSGKSAFLDTIPVALYGRYPYMNGVATIINNNEKIATLDAKLTIDNKPSSIKRTIKRIGVNKSSMDIEFIVDGVNLTEDTTGTKRNIEEYLGSLEDYTRTAYVSQKSPDLFLNMKNSERKEWMSKNLGLEIYEYLHDLAKVESKEKASEIEFLSKTDWVSKQVELINEINAHENELNILQKAEQKLLKAKESVEENITILNNQRILESSKLIDIPDDIDESIENQKLKIKRINDIIQKLSDVDSDEDLLKLKYELNNKLNDLNNRLDSVKKLEYFNGDKILEKKSKLKEILEKGKEVKKLIDSLTNNISVSEYIRLQTGFIESIKETEISAFNDDIQILNEVRLLDNFIEKEQNNIKILENDERFENEKLCRTCPLLSNAFESKNKIIEYKQKRENIYNKLLNKYNVKFIDDLYIKNLLKEKQQEIYELEQKLKLIEKKEQERLKLLEEYKQLNSSINDLIKSDEDNRQMFISNILQQIEDIKKLYEEKISLRKLQLENLIKEEESNLEKSKIKLQELEELKEKVKINIDIKNVLESLDKQINDNINFKRKLVSELDEITKKINEFKVNINTNKLVLKEVEDTIFRLKQLKEEYVKYEHYIIATHKNNIPMKIVDNIIKLLENEVNLILSRLGEYRLKFEIDDKNLNCLVNHSIKGELNADRLCGMESFIVNLAIRIAMANISNTPTANFLIVDEGFSALDSDNIQAVPQLFEFLKTKYDFILVVSHDVFMRDFVDYNFEIEIDENGKSVLIA